MASLFKSSRRAGLALVLACGLTLLAAVATPLLGNEFAKFVGPATALADESSGSGG